jgi:hypothetical protein
MRKSFVLSTALYWFLTTVYLFIIREPNHKPEGKIWLLIVSGLILIIGALFFGKRSYVTFLMFMLSLFLYGLLYITHMLPAGVYLWMVFLIFTFILLSGALSFEIIPNSVSNSLRPIHSRYAVYLSIIFPLVAVAQNMFLNIYSIIIQAKIAVLPPGEEYSAATKTVLNYQLGTGASLGDYMKVYTAILVSGVLLVFYNWFIKIKHIEELIEKRT